MTDKERARMAISKINEIHPLLSEAEESFSKARTWGIFDILGGGLLSNLFKYNNLDNAQNTMSEIQYKLNELSSILGNFQIPTDYRMEMNDFVTFADFVFDGLVVDIFVSSKIANSLDQVKQLQQRLFTLSSKLRELSQ